MTIHETVRRVILDVMVRDANGKPVHGLTQEDFTVAEDKRPQKVLSFDTYDIDTPSISRGPNAAPLPQGVFVNVPATPERGPLYVMLLDLVNTEQEDQMRARQQVLKFIASKPEGTRFAVFVTSDMLRLVQGFTDDKNLLYEVLSSKRPRSHVPRVFLQSRNYGYGDPYTAIDMLTHIGQYLDGIPGRKNLIWVSGTFPLALGAQESDSAYWETDVKAVLNGMAQGRIAIFPMDVTGVSFDSGALVRYASEDLIADATGGRAFYSRNDVNVALQEATDDGGSYYTLTYSPPGPMEDDTCHTLTVRVKPPTDSRADAHPVPGSYKLSFRRYYCHVSVVETADTDTHGHAAPAAVVVPLEAADVLQGNMKPGAPMLHDLVFSAHVRTVGNAGLATPEQMGQLEQQAAFFREHRGNKPLKPLPPVRIQTYAIDYRVLDPQFKAQAASGKQPALELAVAAFDEDGKVLNGMVNDALTDGSSTEGIGSDKSGVLRARQILIVPVNAKSVRVGVRDRITDRMGTLEVTLPLTSDSTRASAAH